MLLRVRLLLRLGPNVITDGTFITLGSNYYTCAFYRPCNKTLCLLNSQNPDPHLSFLLDQSSPIQYSTTLTSILCFTSLNIYVCKCGELTGISTTLLLLKGTSIVP